MTDLSLLLERAELLLDQGRTKDAEGFIKQVLQQAPDNDHALVLLARCCISDKRFSESIELLQKAIALDAYNSFYFYLLGFAYYQQNIPLTAKQHLDTAIRLNPYNPEYFGLLAYILIDEKRFEEALDKANEGLALEAENITCLNGRSIALNKLKRTEDAFATMQNALAQDPDNEMTHATVGWNLLEKGRHKEATHHFLEALRIEPNYNNAKSGLKEALKSKILPYKWLLQYSFWVSNKGRKLQTFLPIALYIVFRILIALSSSSKTESLTLLLVGLYILIVVTSWSINSIANFFLLYHPIGKFALTVSERWSAISVVSAMLTGLTLLSLASFTQIAQGSDYEAGLFFSGLVLLSLALPLGNMQFPITTNGLAKRGWYTLCLAGLGVASILVFMVLPAVALFLFALYGISFIIYNWLGLAR